MKNNISVDAELKAKVEAIVAEINAFVDKGKWELFNEDAKYLVSKFPLNDLLAVGVKHVKIPHSFYLELPYSGIDDAMLVKILYRLSNVNRSLEEAGKSKC